MILSESSSSCPPWLCSLSLLSAFPLSVLPLIPRRRSFTNLDFDHRVPAGFFLIMLWWICWIAVSKLVIDRVPAGFFLLADCYQKSRRLVTASRNKHNRGADRVNNWRIRTTPQCRKLLPRIAIYALCSHNCWTESETIKLLVHYRGDIFVNAFELSTYTLGTYYVVTDSWVENRRICCFHGKVIGM